jgi:hypothetical protein
MQDCATVKYFPGVAMKLVFCLFAGLILSLGVLATGSDNAKLSKKTYTRLDLHSSGE